MPRAFDDDWVWPAFPYVGGSGSLHDLRDADDRTVKSRLWDLRSTSKAACMAYDKRPAQPKARRVGFAARRP